MHYIDQAVFAEPENSGQLDDYPLVVHRRPESASRRLLLLIHGLTGHRYGYWGMIPEFLLRDFSDCDIGLYFYRTAGRRLGFNRSVNLDVEAGILASELTQANNYAEVLLIGHSMGGLLAKAAIYTLLTERNYHEVRRIVGLILLACPQLGSLRVPSFLRLLSRDARALFPHNELIRRIQAAFTSRVSLEVDAGDDIRISLPTWVGVAAADCWVDALSASIGIPWTQQQLLRGGHSDIIRPKSKDASSYVFIKNAATAALQQRRSTRFGVEFVVEDAAVTDVPRIMELGMQYFPGDITADEDLTPFVGAGNAFKVIRSITKQGPVVLSEVKGYLCIFYLTAEAAAQVLAGTLTGATIKPDHIATKPGDATAAYIGAIAATGPAARAVALEACRLELSFMRTVGIKTIYTRPVTEVGVELAKSRGFRPVSGNGGVRTLYRQKHH